MKQKHNKWIAGLLAGMLCTGTIGAFPATAETLGETDENNTLLTAEPIAVNTPTTGALSSDDDADYYQFTLEENGLLQFQFLTDESEWVYHFNLTFYDENGILLNQWKDILNYQTETTAYAAGTYYCKVDKFANSSEKNYTLTVHDTPQSQWTTASDYEIEPNDTLPKATELLSNVATIGKLNSIEDIDYYKITIEADGVLQLHFQHDVISTTLNQWEISFLDANGTLRNIWENAGSNGNMFVPAYGCHAGTYYCKIERSSYMSDAINVDYTLTANFQAAAESETMFETETNDSFATANMASANTAISGNIFTESDSDYYQFDLDAASQFTVQFDHALAGDGTKNPWTVTLYQLVGKTAEPIQTLQSADNMASITFDSIRSYPGTYYLQVSSERYHSDTDYTVTFQAEEIPYTRGDVDASDSVEITDAFLALTASSRASAGLELGLTDAEFFAADADESNSITISDAFYILMYNSTQSAGATTSWEEIISNRH